MNRHYANSFLFGGIFIKKSIVYFTYEIVLAGLIIYSLIVNLPNNQDKVLSWFVWVLFLVDYIVRFIVSKDKWEYVKKHPLELLAIIPFDQVFRALRLVRIIRLIRLLVLLKRKDSFLEVLTQKYKVDRIFVIVIALLFLSALPMYWIEPSFNSFEDALWWSIVTTTTVGYGDLYPQTAVGRIIASFLMFVGIGLIATITGMAASYFSREKELPEELRYVRERIDNYSSLSNEEIDLIIRKLENLKGK